MRTTALFAATIAIALGCATSGSSAGGAAVAPPRSTGSTSAQPGTSAAPAGDTLSPRAQRLFDEAVA